MSIGNPVIDYIDGEIRQIHLREGVTEWNPVDDIYVEVRQLRQDVESLRGFDMFCEALPLIEKSPGKSTGRGLVLLGGTRIVPFDETATQTITGELLSDEGISGTDLVDLAGLSATSKIKISYEPPRTAEIIKSGSGLSAEQVAQLNQIGSDARWTYMAHYHKREESETDQTITLYAADGTTPLRVFDANTDGTLINPRFVP